MRRLLHRVVLARSDLEDIGREDTDLEDIGPAGTVQVDIVLEGTEK